MMIPNRRHSIPRQYSNPRTDPVQRERFRQHIEIHHYLKSDVLVGEQLRYVAEVDGRWVCALSWSAPAHHLNDREQWLGWNIFGGLNGVCSRGLRSLASVPGGPHSGFERRRLPPIQGGGGRNSVAIAPLSRSRYFAPR
jgi:hypothetical protein